LTIELSPFYHPKLKNCTVHCTIESYAFGLPKNHPHQKTAKKFRDQYPSYQLREGMGYCEGKAVFSAALRGQSVLSGVFTKVFVCIHADLPKSMEMF
jgi:hypothetical protein